MIYEDGVASLTVNDITENSVYACEIANGIGVARSECRILTEQRKEISAFEDQKNFANFIFIMPPAKEGLKAILNLIIELRYKMLIDVKIDKTIVTNLEKEEWTRLTKKVSTKMAVDDKVVLTDEQMRTNDGTIKWEMDQKGFEVEVETNKHYWAPLVNYIIDADAIVINLLNYKMSAKIAKKEGKKPLVREETTTTIIIEEETIKKKFYTHVAERCIREIRSCHKEALERSMRNNLAVADRQKYFRQITSTKHELQEEWSANAESQGSPARLIAHVNESTEVSELHERYQDELVEEIKIEKRKVKERIKKSHEVIVEGEQKDDNEITMKINLIANPEQEFAHANVITVINTNYKKTVDIRQIEHETVEKLYLFQIINEQWMVNRKYFTSSIGQPPRFIKPFSIHIDRNLVELKCKVYGSPSPKIRLLYNDRPILRDNR